MLSESHIAAQNVTKQFKQGSQIITILNQVNFSCVQSATYAITGVSGSGKSTLMHMLAGLDTPTHGAVYFNNRSFAQMNQRERQQILNQSIGLVFQSPYLIRELTVLENVMLPGMISGSTRAACTKKAQDLLDAVGLVHKKNEQPSTLSGGQQQRVALARALFNRPSFLLADEPTGNLDARTGKEILSLLITLQKEWKMGLIISTHDPHITEAMHYRFALKNGTLSPLP